MNQVTIDRVENDVLLIRLAGRWELRNGLASVGALETELRRRQHIQWAIERVCAAIQVHRANDLPGSSVPDPDVAVFTTREIDAPAVW